MRSGGRGGSTKEGGGTSPKDKNEREEMRDQGGESTTYKRCQSTAPFCMPFMRVHARERALFACRLPWETGGPTQREGQRVKREGIHRERAPHTHAYPVATHAHDNTTRTCQATEEKGRHEWRAMHDAQRGERDTGSATVYSKHEFWAQTNATGYARAHIHTSMNTFKHTHRHTYAHTLQNIKVRHAAHVRELEQVRIVAEVTRSHKSLQV